MKKNTVSRDRDCNDFEALLLQAQVSALPAAEAAALEAHLNSCPHCRAYGDKLVRLQSATQLAAQPRLVPDPAIYFQLAQKVRAQAEPQAHRWRAITQRLLAPLRYRVPLYQAALGAATLLLLFSTMNSMIVSKPSTFVDSTRVLPGKHTPYYLYQDSTLTDSLRLGRNIKEDSLLLRFVSTAM